MQFVKCEGVSVRASSGTDASEVRIRGGTRKGKNGIQRGGKCIPRHRDRGRGEYMGKERLVHHATDSESYVDTVTVDVLAGWCAGVSVLGGVSTYRIMV